MSKYDPDVHRRRSVRLPGYDYARPGAYFVTVCTKGRECLLGDVVQGEVRLNPFGAIAWACWEDLPCHYPHVELDAFVVMPNHVHGVIVLTDDLVGAGFKPAPTIRTPACTDHLTRHGLPEIVRAFKTYSSRRINTLRGGTGLPFWQRNYYEHILRDEEEWNRVREYIMNNPAGWPEDEYHPARREM